MTRMIMTLVLGQRGINYKRMTAVVNNETVVITDSISRLIWFCKMLKGFENF